MAGPAGARRSAVSNATLQFPVLDRDRDHSSDGVADLVAQPRAIWGSAGLFRFDAGSGIAGDQPIF